LDAYDAYYIEGYVNDDEGTERCAASDHGLVQDRAGLEHGQGVIG
jgi:hypothetical protein